MLSSVKQMLRSLKPSMFGYWAGSISLQNRLVNRFNLLTGQSGEQVQPTYGVEGDEFDNNLRVVGSEQQ